MSKDINVEFNLIDEFTPTIKKTQQQIPKRYSIQKRPAILELKKQIALKIKRHKDFELDYDKTPYSWTGFLIIGEFNLAIHWKNFIKLKSVDKINISQHNNTKWEHLTKTQLNELNELLK